jgi:hypothetical protein
MHARFQPEWPGAFALHKAKLQEDPAGGLMGKEQDLLGFGSGKAQSQHAPSEALTWYTPVRFDPGLLRRLLDQHDTLDAHVASLPNRFRRNREEAWNTAQACAGQLHELRRQEALWVYPVIAHSLASDPAARRRLLNLRFVMNGLARRVLRSLDELVQAMRQLTDIAAAAATVSSALAEYRQRNESELYTLYCLMDPRQNPMLAKSNGHG